LSKTQNVTKLTSQISSSRRMFSWLSRALRVIVSNDGVGVAMAAPLASDNDNPAALRTGTVLLRRFRLEVCDAKLLPRLTARLTLKLMQDTPNEKRIFSSATTSPRSRTFGATDLDRPHPGLDCPMRPMAMAHDTVAAIRQFQILPHGDKGIGLGDQHLGQHSASAFSCKFAQWIVNRLRLTQRDDNTISRHGVSLLSGGSGRLDTRLDTPPSTNRRHPDSFLAP
jgi:hypothetical protein